MTAPRAGVGSDRAVARLLRGTAREAGGVVERADARRLWQLLASAQAALARSQAAIAGSRALLAGVPRRIAVYHGDALAAELACGRAPRYHRAAGVWVRAIVEAAHAGRDPRTGATAAVGRPASPARWGASILGAGLEGYGFTVRAAHRPAARHPAPG